jgi:hypothetical protein
MNRKHNLDRPALHRLLATAIFAAALVAPVARATSLVVPDQSPTIQAAIDAGVDTVLVRPAAYPETLKVSRAIAILGVPDPSGGRPMIAGLSIFDDSGRAPTMRYERLQFSGTATVFSYPSAIAFDFVQCDLQGGITDTRYWGSIDRVQFSRCHVVGPLSLPGALYVSLDSCDVIGSIIATAEDHVMEVRDCTFQGGGVYSSPYQSTCRVERNTIRGGGFGIYAGGHDVVVADNLIEDVQSVGLQAGDEGPVIVTNNVIRRCDIGIIAAGDETTVAANLIEDCASGGLFADFGVVAVNHNVVRRCGTGIRVDADQATVAGNTVTQSRTDGLRIRRVRQLEATGNVLWMCAANGIKLDYDVTRESVKVRQNTSCYNGLSGFAADSSTAAQEWTGNIGSANQEYGMSWQRADAATIACNDWFGNRKGSFKGRALSSEDLSLDPQLCDGPGGDLHLDQASPLLDWPGCGQIGALGAGCGAIAGLGGEAAMPPGFTLGRIGPVPARGRVALEIALPRAAAIEVAVHDVQGRMVARLASGEWSAGRHALEWNGEGAQGRVTPGLYFIRYRYPGGHVARPIVIAR